MNYILNQPELLIQNIIFLKDGSQILMSNKKFMFNSYTIKWLICVLCKMYLFYNFSRTDPIRSNFLEQVFVQINKEYILIMIDLIW